ncbi:unnamed protein product [Bursaphelenchus okinawaensis]|uniref:Inositol polyphosphate-related phosphatase domain-containing protein n=1 Tax=Bursaphelenchus okinawaensis TaxID=465554 RepID=A0A811JTB5_9BILA|nr:unnamed protein product [Bursaphelenchus okinawaensis]CAG9082048.1 unnamed protein product [Bursaphelenchus okinawaensis]
MSFGAEFFIDDLLHTQESRFCTFTNAKIHATTFNVNGKSPPDYLGNWLTFDSENLPHFLVIGLQEMDLALGTYVTDNASRQHEWLYVLQRNIPNTYVQIDCVRLIGIFIVAYQLQPSQFAVSEVQSGIVPTGFLKFGNKGGVGISMKINDSYYCFINSHLAAGGGELSRRNQDFRDISQMKFADGKGIYDHDAVIWLGDLNYRLNSSFSYEEVVHKCNSNNFIGLFHHDQLKEQQRVKTAFNAFHEETPSFRPTYKFDVGTSTWDTSEKRRVPAWCDRVLYWTKDKTVKLKQVTYESREAVVFSDHKPVCSNFQAEIKKVDKKKRNLVYDELLRETDRKTNDLLPSIQVSSTEVSFGQVYFRQPSVKVLTIKNTGITATRFAFANKHQSSDLPENWLTLTPKSSFIDVDDEVEVTLQVVVDNEEAWKIDKRTELNCILVIRLDKGRDYFLVVNAVYEPSCFGVALESLLGKGIQKKEELLIDFSDDTQNTGKPKNIPPPILYMVQALRKVGLNRIRYDETFSDDAFFIIRDVMEKEQYHSLGEIAQSHPSTLYSTLHVFLRSLRSSLLTSIPLVGNVPEVDSFYKYVASITPPSKEVFNFLVIFFRELNAVNKLSLSQMEIIVGSIFRKVPKGQDMNALRFVKWCITLDPNL